MFTIICPQEATEVLLGSRRIERLERTDEGIVIHWRCYCGAEGRSLVADTRRALRQPAAA